MATVIDNHWQIDFVQQLYGEILIVSTNDDLVDEMLGLDRRVEIDETTSRIQYVQNFKGIPTYIFSQPPYKIISWFLHLIGVEDDDKVYAISGVELEIFRTLIEKYKYMLTNI